MKPKLNSFEKLVLQKLFSIEKRIGRLEGKAMAWGAIAGLVVTAIGEIVIQVVK